MFWKIMNKRISAVLVIAMLLTLLTGCGSEDEDSAYRSPNFDKGQSESEDDVAVDERSTLTDALAELAFTSQVDVVGAASQTDAYPMGIYEASTYYNGLAGFSVTVDNVNWSFYDEAQVASVSDASEDDIINLWSGLKSPYDQKTSYAMIACKTSTGASIVISYINPELYLMSGLTAKEYLSMSLAAYEDVDVTTVTMLGDIYAALDVPASQSSVGRRTQFAIEKEGLIILITITTLEDDELTEALGLFSTLDD